MHALGLKELPNALKQYLVINSTERVIRDGIEIMS